MEPELRISISVSIFEYKKQNPYREYGFCNYCIK